MANTKKLIQAAAGAAGGEALNIEDVFSTYLYDGTASARDITNGINLADEGGLIWTKQRGIGSNNLNDTERGVGKYLTSNNTAAEGSDSLQVTAYNTDGYSLGVDSAQGTVNYTYSTGYASWTFRKAPKFFDVVTYTGDGVAGREIAHNLGTTVGFIVVKRTDTIGGWQVYHRSLGATKFLLLNDTFAATTNNTRWYDTEPTSTHFTVNNINDMNASGGTYVAYLFAHNDGDGEFGDGTQDIIKCGSWTTAGTGSPEVNLGFEPQWIMFKRTDGTGDWRIYDTMRGWLGSDQASNAQWLKPNTSDAESTLSNSLYVTPTGFVSTGIGSGTDYIYIAIRRGPMAVPESATDVFNISYGTATAPWFDAGFPVDLGMHTNRTGYATNARVVPRLTSPNYLYTSSTSAEISADTTNKFDYMDGYNSGAFASTDFIAWMWRRAPNYFDVVAYTGTASSGNSFAPQNVSHNLDAVPEMMWVKCRSTGGSITYRWHVYHKDVGNTKALFLNETSTAGTGTAYWDNTTPTDSVFRVGGGYGVNQLGETYIAYLFASLDGVSKVGSYTGTGAAQNIDCGFSSGARFVLIRRTDISDNWEVFDTERGIVAGNDPRLLLDDNAAEYTAKDFVDPYSSGFAVTTELSKSGGNYIFYAIA